MPTSSPVYWIASYPKSGNTWVRFLLYQYIWGELRDTRELSLRVPDIHRGELDRADPRGGLGGDVRRLLVKTHYVMSPNLPSLSRTAGAIYIVRHPKDVLLSALNYMRLSGQIGPAQSDEDYIRSFIKTGGDPSFLQWQVGTWEHNVMSWCMQRRFPLLFLRYRDLKKDAAAELRRIVEFLGLPLDEQRLRGAVAASTFERMRSLEESEIAAGRTGTVFDRAQAQPFSGRRFMSSGEAGRTLAAISPELDAEFNRTFRYPLWVMGYGVSATAPPDTLPIPA